MVISDQAWELLLKPKQGYLTLHGQWVNAAIHSLVCGNQKYMLDLSVIFEIYYYPVSLTSLQYFCKYKPSSCIAVSFYFFSIYYLLDISLLKRLLILQM